MPVAVDQHIFRLRKDAEGELFARVLKQAGRGTDGYSQGVYLFTADGTLLGFSNTADAKHVNGLLEKALKKFDPAAPLPKAPAGKAGAVLPPPPEGGLVLDSEQRVVAPLEPDRGRDLHVHGRAAAERSAEMPGPDLDVVAEREQALAQAVEDPARALGLLDGQVRPGDVADEQGVAREHGPRLRRARGVDEGERRVLRPVAGCRDRPNADRPDRQLPPVVDRVMRILGLGQPAHVDGRAGRGGEPPVPGDVIRVVVRLEDVRDPHPREPGERQVGLDIQARVDDRRLAGGVVADDVGGAAEIVVDELSEDHEGRPWRARTHADGARRNLLGSWAAPLDSRPAARACTSTPPDSRTTLATGDADRRRAWGSLATG